MISPRVAIISDTIDHIDGIALGLRRLVAASRRAGHAMTLIGPAAAGDACEPREPREPCELRDDDGVVRIPAAMTATLPFYPDYTWSAPALPPIRLAAGARVTHAWPDGVAGWLQVRLLRGADTASLLPYVVAHYAPRAAPWIARLGRGPALAVLGLRAVTGTWTALRRGPVVRGLALVAGVTVVDAIGAAAGPAVYRVLA
ncbi:MAG TPA: hypothetical protein VH165_19115 [Kofleriaceae bacterium]|nr:hypothetical protein [Kofleriaceae bacterium]